MQSEWVTLKQQTFFTEMNVIHSSYSSHYITSAIQLAWHIHNHFNSLFSLNPPPDALMDCVLVTSGFESTVIQSYCLSFLVSLFRYLRSSIHWYNCQCSRQTEQSGLMVSTMSTNYGISSNNMDQCILSDQVIPLQNTFQFLGYQSYHRSVQHAQPTNPLFICEQQTHSFLLQPYIKSNQLIIHCTLQLIRWEGSISSEEIQYLLRDEITRLTSDYQNQRVFQKDLTLQIIFPSLRLNLTHQSNLFSNLTQKLENSDTCQNNPILCPCVPAAHFCWESYEIHRHPVNAYFILHSILSSHILDWLQLNHFQLYRCSETGDGTQAYLTSTRNTGRQLVLRYSRGSEQHTLEVLYQPFISTLLQPPITPLSTLLECSQRKRNRMTIPETEEKVLLHVYLEQMSTELQLNSVLFDLLSRLFNSVLTHQVSSSTITNSTLFIHLILFIFREQEVVRILLQRCIHSTQHFYAFLPVLPTSHSHTCPLLSNKFSVPFVHSKSDSISMQANSYLFSIIQFNLSIRFFTLPDSMLHHLHTIASENVEYAFINHSQAFFTICDSRGNSLTSRETEFSLYLLFLHDFSSQSSMRD